MLIQELLNELSGFGPNAKDEGPYLDFHMSLHELFFGSFSLLQLCSQLSLIHGNLLL